MISRSTRLAATLLSTICIGTLAHAQADEAGFKKLDSYFAAQLAKKKTPSISVAVVQKGKVIYGKGFGIANLEDQVPATANSVYRIGSITKQFTATMIMQLVKEGKLRVDDPFETILDDMPRAWAKVTVRNLLNHTSGVKSYTEISGLFAGDAMKPTNPAGIIKKVADAPLDFEPGTKWHYSNSGYELLGMIIEKLDKRTYAESLSARILTPLGMTNTYFVSENQVVPHRAQGYSNSNVGFRHSQYLNMDWPYAAGSIESTVLDLAKWDAALYGDSILPQDMLAQMWTATTLADGTPQQYGFGWQFSKSNGVDIVEHGGGIHGFTTQIRRCPTLGITVIVLTNSDSGGDPATLAKEAMGIVEPSLQPKAGVDKSPTTTKHDQEVLQSLLDGKLDRTSLTPEFAVKLTPEKLAAAKSQLAALGKILKFEYVSEQVIEPLNARIYKVTFALVELTYSIAVDSDGKIGGLEIHQ